ncbi:MAG: hypothetical protein ACI4K7_00495 [Oscillospiraceae bacterium]
MKLIPEYCKNVIAGVMYRRKFGWYVTPEYIWRMDYRKEYKAWEEYYQNSGRTKNSFCMMWAPLSISAENGGASKSLTKKLQMLF